MTAFPTRRALAAAVAAARAAGAMMRQNWRAPKKVNAATQHDIKLELDVRCQELISRRLRRAFPGVAVLGEEGVHGDPQARHRWVVDPIDGTVNFAYGIPHACVSIALQDREPPSRGHRPTSAQPEEACTTLLGVVFDPFCDELWTAVRGGPARLNGRVIRVSRRRKLAEAIIAMGFAKNRETLRVGLPLFHHLIRRVRKVRMMGAAALGMAYVASGRFDAYLEHGIRLWDIAAGGLIVECAGGEFWHEPLPGPHTFRLVANNGWLRPQLRR
jgi:myo-inositol-1(or 4)-monophosphatase